MIQTTPTRTTHNTPRRKASPTPTAPTHTAGYGRVVAVTDAPQPVAVHRLGALSGGTDLYGYGGRLAVDVDGFFAAEP